MNARVALALFLGLLALFFLCMAVREASAWDAKPALRTPDLTCRVRNSRGEVVRSRSRRAMFMRMIGYPNGRVPHGYAVNHIVPLACGGCDVPSNMELMTTLRWKGRTGPERADCGRHEGGTWVRAVTVAEQ